METETNNNKTRLFQYCSLFIVALISGILIGLFEVAVKFLFDGINRICENSIYDNYTLPIYTIACSLIVLAFYTLIIVLKQSIGASHSVLIRYLSKDKIKIYEYPLLILGFFISLFSGIPAGGVEVCQCIGVGLASEVYKRTNIQDNDGLDSISSASFGAFFMSPLAGFAYAVESRKWKISLSYILKTLLAIAVVVGACYLTKMIFNLQNHYLFRLNKIETFSWKSIWLYGLMGIIIALIAPLINLSSLKLKQYFDKKKGYYFPTICTYVILVTALICTYFGIKNQFSSSIFAGFDGSKVFASYSQTFKNGGLLVAAIFIWILYIALLPHSKIVGGKILPLMTLGCLIGFAFAMNGKDSGSIKIEEELLMIVTAMFALFGVTYRKPVTAFCLALTFSRWSIIPYQLIPLLLTIVPGYLCLLFTKTPSLNECLGLKDSLELNEE